MIFECDKCGACCKHLDLCPSIYGDLDRGDGVCKYLADNLCSIYEQRPLKCNIQESYETHFKNIYSIEEFYRLNKLMCIKLKNL